MGARPKGRAGGRAAVAVLLLLAGCGSGTGGGVDVATPSRTVTVPSGTTPVPSPSSAPPTAPSTRPLPAPPASFDVRSLFGTDWEGIPTSRALVALTFDGGGSDAAVGSVLSTLARSDVTATFFVTGDFARRYPVQVRRIAEAGHRLGNHSDRHPEYPDLSSEEIREDLHHAETSIVSAAGVSPSPLFRFPFGARTSADIRAVNEAGYVAVRWTVDTLGWKGTSGGMTADAVVDRVLDTARPGQIVLMHVGANPDDGTTLDADALPRVIDGLRARGYEFVTLDAMVR